MLFNRTRNVFTKASTSECHLPTKIYIPPRYIIIHILILHPEQMCNVTAEKKIFSLCSPACDHFSFVFFFFFFFVIFVLCRVCMCVRVRVCVCGGFFFKSIFKIYRQRTGEKTPRNKKTKRKKKENTKKITVTKFFF